jgi:agmatine deiminase
MSFAMPAEFAPHERTLMAWPARPSLWEQHYEQAKADYAEIANAIAAFEPVLMVTDPSQAAEARAACGEGVDVAEIPIDDSWMRDSGPIFVLDGAGGRAGVDFAFNSWGGKFEPYDDDAEMAARVLAHLGEERVDARDLVLEGGSIAVDGDGTLITTEQCLLDPTRNPGLSRDQIARRLQDALGVHTVVWLGRGLVEDVDTDGHVDNLCAPIGPGRVLLQTVADEASPNWDSTRENAARLQAAGLEVVELPLLPYVDHDGPPTVVPYTNFYLCNGALIVPVTGQETDEEALALLGGLYPGREVVPVPGVTLALGGGGVHCITQQVPAIA